MSNNTQPPPPPPIFHSWNELHKVLLARGWRQVITHDERIAYTNGIRNVVLQKSDKLDIVFVTNFCALIGRVIRSL
jgi:hypothetical protein